MWILVGRECENMTNLRVDSIFVKLASKVFLQKEG